VSSLEHSFETSSSDVALPASNGARVEARKGWWNGLSLRGKLGLAVFGNTIVLALIAIIMLAGTWQLGQGGHAQAILASVEVRTNNAAIALVDASRSLEAAENAGTAEAREVELAEAAAALDLAHETLTDPIEFAGDRMPSKIGPVVEGFRSSVDELRGDLASARGTNTDLGALRDKTDSLYAEVSTFAVDFHAEAAESADRLFASISNFVATFLILTIVGVTLSLFFSRYVIRDVTGMIRRMTGSMEQVAAGETGTAIPGAERGDEIGAMARTLSVFRAKSLELQALNASRVEDAEKQLAQQQLLSEQMRNLRLDKSNLLEGMANGFEVSVGDLITSVSAASEQLKATSRKMVELADGSREQASSATSAMEKATSNVTAAAAATDEFATSIGEISRQATASAQLARDATTLVSTANTRMAELSQAAIEVGEIVELIQTIAQRTNLLALNASIEAARGGEAGRGFAVVASEVKELANQTANAAGSVTERITAMQDSTEASAGDLGTIVERISELEQAAVTIAGAVDEQSVSGEELARNIDTVASGAAQVGERLAALKSASEETGTAAEDVVASANALGEHADDLRTKAGRFIEDVRSSARDLEAGSA